MARFLEGRQVKVVWGQMEDMENNECPYSLILCTDITHKYRKNFIELREMMVD